MDDSWLGPVVCTSMGLAGILDDFKGTQKPAEAGRHMSSSSPMALLRSGPARFDTTPLRAVYLQR